MVASRDEDMRTAAAADLVLLAPAPLAAVLTQSQCNVVRALVWHPQLTLPHGNATRMEEEFICVRLSKCTVDWKHTHTHTHTSKRGGFYGKKRRKSP